MIEWHPTNLKGPYVVNGQALWAHVVRIDTLAWYKAGQSTRTIIDAQGEFLARHCFQQVFYDESTQVWDGWSMVNPALKTQLRQFAKKYPQWVHRPTWDAVPPTHMKYLPTLPDSVVRQG